MSIVQYLMAGMVSFPRSSRSPRAQVALRTPTISPTVTMITVPMTPWTAVTATWTASIRWSNGSHFQWTSGRHLRTQISKTCKYLPLLCWLVLCTSMHLRMILLYPPQTLFVGGILFSRCPSVCACVRPSVTLCFLNNLKSHCWIFIKPCKHVHICKTNTLDKKVRARGQFY